MGSEESLKRWCTWCGWGARAPVEDREAGNTGDQQQQTHNTTESQLQGKNSLPISSEICLHIMLGWENMLRSTEEVHYRMISLPEKCRCKGNAGTGLVSMLSCCMGASPLPPCTAPALLKIFLRIIFYLPLHQLLQSPHRARLPHQSLLSLTGN